MFYSRFLKKGKRETKTEYIIYLTHAYTTRVTITVTVRIMEKKQGRKRKQCFERRKTMLSGSENNAFHSSNG